MLSVVAVVAILYVVVCVVCIVFCSTVSAFQEEEACSRADTTVVVELTLMEQHIVELVLMRHGRTPSTQSG